MKSGYLAWVKEILCFPKWPEERRNTNDDATALWLEELRLLTRRGLEEDNGKHGLRKTLKRENS